MIKQRFQILCTLRTSQASFSVNSESLFQSDVLLYLPENSALNLEVDGRFYETSSVILRSSPELLGQSSYGGGSLLDNTERMGMKFMEEVEGDIAEEGDGATKESRSGFFLLETLFLMIRELLEFRQSRYGAIF